MLIQAVRDFAERGVCPHLHELEQGNVEVGRRLFRQAAELGIFIAEVPEEFGGLDLMFDADNQQLVASLSDVAIEIFGAESAVLGVGKARATGVEHGDLLGVLARLAFARAADRVRQESNEVLAAVSDAGQMRARLGDLAGWLPLPAGLIEARTLIAHTLLERGGLPAGDLQPAS